MSRRTPPAAVLAGSPDEIEAQFYKALQQADLERLMTLWADDDEVVCVHPGGTRVIGPAGIRASFEAIFSGGGIPVRPVQVHRLLHLGCAVHHLVERVESGAEVGWVLATNVYLKTALGWRLAAHHASAGEPQDVTVPVVAEAPSTLH